MNKPNKKLAGQYCSIKINVKENTMKTIHKNESAMSWIIGHGVCCVIIDGHCTMMSRRECACVIKEWRS
jgi:hypothetical protein